MSQLTFNEFLKLSPEERRERVGELSAHDLFLVRMGYWGGKPVDVPCNFCCHNQGGAKCEAFPDGIPGEHMDKVMKNPDTPCAEGMRYQPAAPEALAEKKKRWAEEVSSFLKDWQPSD